MTTKKIAIPKVPAKRAVKPAVKTTAAAPALASRRAQSTQPTQPVKSTKPSAAVGTSEPSMRFYHSVALQRKTHAVLDALEAAPDLPEHGEAVADLVTELIGAGMEYYFLRGLKLAKVGFVVEQSARLAMSGAVKLVSSVSQRFIVNMDKTQLLAVASHIRSLT